VGYRADFWQRSNRTGKLADGPATRVELRGLQTHPEFDLDRDQQQ
jgi:hypothetical protein